MARSALLIAILLAAITLLAGDKPPDPHFLAARTSSMVRKSAFVHGYLHGYEEGFHLADLDLQMGRRARAVNKSKEARDSAGYRREFGDKGRFGRGYAEGLRVGYADGFAGRNFRALDALQAIAGVAPNEAEVSPDQAFDQAFALGYTSGQQQGVKDGRTVATFASPEVACPAPQWKQQSFCAGYVGGYRFGYSDGFTNVARPVMAQAKARGGGK